MVLNCRSLSARCMTLVAVVSFLILVCSSTAGAQLSKVGATLEGTVSDSSGAVIPKATITLRNTLTNQFRAVTADDRGFFRADELPVGTSR